MRSPEVKSQSSQGVKKHQNSNSASYSLRAARRHELAAQSKSSADLPNLYATAAELRAEAERLERQMQEIEENERKGQPAPKSLMSKLSHLMKETKSSANRNAFNKSPKKGSQVNLNKDLLGYRTIDPSSNFYSNQDIQ